MKTYMVSCGAHVSSSIGAFTNYFGRKPPAQVAAMHDDMREELGEHVIVDGTDDWNAKVFMRPEVFIREFTKATGREPLALYHSGTSGITKSGVVLRPEDFDELTVWYKGMYGVEIDKTPLRLTFNSNSTAL